MLDRIEFLLSEAFLSLRRNTWMTFAAVTTAAMALFLLGGLTFYYLRIQEFAASLPDRFEISVFLKSDVTAAAAAQRQREILAIPGVKSATLVTKEQGWADWRKKYPDVTSGLDNPFPHVVKVTVKDLEHAPAVVARLKAVKDVEPGDSGVSFLDDEHAFLNQSMRVVRWLGIGLGGMMLLTSGVLIYNAIRLTVMARRRELRIMLLVGATRATVWTPLLIEGFVQGALGGLLASFALWTMHSLIQHLITSLSGLGRLEPYPLPQATAMLMAVGAAYGLICSTFAVREPRSLA